MDRRQGAGLLRIGADRDAGRHLLPDLRLASDDRDGGQLAAGAPARHRAPAHPRDRCRDRRLSARASRCMPGAWRLLRDRADAGGARFRAADRAHSRPDHLRALYRLDDRPDDRRQRGDRAILAGLEADRGRGRHFPDRAVRRGQHHLAEIRRRTRRLASAVDDLRHVRLRLSVRLRRAVAGGAARGRDGGAVPLWAAPLSREPVLFGGKAELMSVPPRQLALALDHAEKLAREDFLSGPPNAAALALVDAWPAWPHRAVILAGPEGCGKSHLAAIWAQAAGARRVAARALDEATVP